MKIIEKNFYVMAFSFLVSGLGPLSQTLKSQKTLSTLVSSVQCSGCCCKSKCELRVNGLSDPLENFYLPSEMIESFSFLRSSSARPTMSDTGDLGDLEHSEVFGLLELSDFGERSDLAGLG